MADGNSFQNGLLILLTHSYTRTHIFTFQQFSTFPHPPKVIATDMRASPLLLLWLTHNRMIFISQNKSPSIYPNHVLKPQMWCTNCDEIVRLLCNDEWWWWSTLSLSFGTSLHSPLTDWHLVRIVRWQTDHQKSSMSMGRGKDYRLSSAPCEWRDQRQRLCQSSRYFCPNVC